MVTEEYFPRGKTKIDVVGGETKTEIVDKKEKKFVNIFSDKDEKKNKKKLKNKGAEKKKPTSVLTVKSVPTLTYPSFKQGIVISGVVSEVNEYDVKVSLPNQLVASLPITNISTSYTEALRKAAEEVEEEGEDEVPPLAQLFKVGQFLVMAVVSCEQEGNKYNLVVSLDPKLVMAGRVPGEGELCTASIISKEDHGYIMDVGNKTVRGFLPNKASQKHWNKNLCVGMVILCTVVKRDKGAVTLKCDPGKVYNNVRPEPNLHNVLPGTVFKAKVVAHMDNGLKVDFGKELSGYLHQHLLPSPNQEVKQYALGTEINVRLVHVIPTVNTVLLSARPVWPFTHSFGDIQSGSLVKDSTVVHVTQRSLLIKLNDSVHGYVSARNAKDGVQVIKNLREKFKVGEAVKCRVLGLDHCSGLAVCSLTKTQTSGVSKLDQLTVGQKVRGMVKQFVEKGLEVTVGGNLTGFIPTLYLSDVPLKHPEKKFFPGDKIDCRVLNVNLEKNRLHLTSKPILVKEEFSVVSTFENATVGTVTEGVVTKISKDGLLISLFGEMRGFAPRSALSTETIELPEKLFFVGQAVKCQITKCEPERNRISLSLVIGSMKPLGKKQKEKSRNLKLGSTYTGKITDITEKGLEVEVTHNDLSVSCVIPTNHLTDSLILAPLLLHAYKVGETIEAVCFQQDVVSLLTKKQIIIEAIQSGELPDGFDSVEVGSVLPGCVESIKKFGIFLKLPIWNYKKTILVPTRNIANFYVEDANLILEIGQTMMVKVVEKVEEGMKLAGSTNIMDLALKDSDGADLMKDFLKDMEFIRRNHETLSTIKIGDLVTATVKEITDLGAILDVNGTVSLAPSNSLGVTKPKPGDTVPAMVVFVDYKAGVLEVSCDQSLITQFAMCQNTPQVGATVKGRIILTRTEYNLQIISVTHPSRLAGCLVYVPTVCHINDLAGEDTETLDKPISVVVQCVTEEDEVIGLNERNLRLCAKRSKKRERHLSVDDGNKLKRRRTESESSVSELLASVVAQDSHLFAAPWPPGPAAASTAPHTQPSAPRPPGPALASTAPHTQPSAPLPTAYTEVPEEEPPAKKKKNKKEKAGKKKDEEPMEVEGNETEIKTKEKVIPDPGWDFSLTGVTLPAWGKVSIWGEDEEKEGEAEDETSKKHVGKKEAKLLRRQEELAAVQEESKVLAGENLPPQSAQDFEKLVLSSPDSSLVWIQYMAFHLQTCQYDQARAVAARAVERINFREEGERLNVFLAWLNLENTFGTQESLDKVLRDALQRNDEYKIYSQMADIYTKSSKFDAAEKIFKILAKKYCKVKEVWIRYGLFFYKNSRTEEGRFIFQRSLQNLDIRDAADISAKFAQIEFRYGDPEIGKTMYEKLVTSHPKRVDLWSSYADQLTRIGDVVATRALYTRISTLGLQAKKMKALFGKWLEFEKVHGTEEQQGEVRRSALQFLNSKDSAPVDA